MENESLMTLETLFGTFSVGDFVRYIPNPNTSSIETIVAIAYGEKQCYLCLSNGEYVCPTYCIKLKVKGAERKRMLDLLSQTEEL